MRGESVFRMVGMMAGAVVLMAGWVEAAPIVVTFVAERDDDRGFPVRPLDAEALNEPERLAVRMVYDSSTQPTPPPPPPTPTTAMSSGVNFQHFAMEELRVSVIGGGGFVDHAVNGGPLSFPFPDAPQNTGMYVTNDFFLGPPAPASTVAESDLQTQGLIGIIGEVTLPVVGTQVAEVFFTSRYNNLPGNSAPLLEDWLALLAGEDAEGRMFISIADPQEPAMMRETLIRGVAEYRIDLGSVVMVPEPSIGAAAVAGLALLLRRRRAFAG